MELRTHEERVVAQLDDLDEASVRGGPREHDSGAGERFPVMVVELEAVAMALVHDGLAARVRGTRLRRELARIHAEPHRAAFLLDVALLGQQVDDRMRREGV